jgi:NAD(P)-dependent dehydrogenase (short-subunit alcohol dehydrogenase family)
MENSQQSVKTVLITGGTSGFGLELARILLNRGCMVVVTGRNKLSLQATEHRFSFFRVDFSNLEESAEVFRKICKFYCFDLIVDNAGVLSPPDFVLTADNFEYTFQVNFLAHLLLNEIAIRSCSPDHALTVVIVTSPVYKVAEKDLISRPSKDEYKAFKAYSKSKLYLALMCKFLPTRFKNPLLNCIGFNPGIFSSGIYRTQKLWFRSAYRIAAPFMKSPVKVANRLAEILENNNLVNGSIYNLRKRPEAVPAIDRTIYDLFWKDCYRHLERFLQ